MIELISPKNGETVSLHTKVQSDFRKQQHHTVYKGTINWEHPERSGNEEATHPAPVVFEWTSDKEVTNLRISKSPDFRGGAIYPVSGTSFSLDNLEIGSAYYWAVDGSEVFSFRTDPTPPRFIRIDKVSNARDIGGWMTKHGRRMKQGLLYRSGRAEDQDSYCGEDQIHDLGIWSEIDLRREMLGKRETATMGFGLRYINLPCDGYEPFIIQKSECKALMEAIADEANLPLIFHCVGGADRTGTLAFILEALCGVDEDDLFLDYELTTLSIWGERSRNAEYFGTLVSALKAYGDENTPWDELAERFILDCGVSAEVIEKIKRILIED